MLEGLMPLIPLIIFGNIENLILASQGVVAGVNMKKLGLLSICFVLMWLIVGTVGTSIALDYANVIDFVGGFAIFVLGIQSMLQATHILGN
ncbi:MAG: hypothetical protein E7Z84_00500 [Methanosphaera stadtmanae]|nr:hypothetical protein [Methanosphaera stadtmanae]